MPERARDGSGGSPPAAVHGVLLCCKPPGISSAAVVARVKRVLGGAKIGHLGTLDPFAAGLLPLCVGEGTKIAPYLNVADKAYTGVLQLGVRTDTLDCTGTVLATAPVPALVSVDLAALARELTGTIEQVPPAYSAIKREGVRMYELARRGEAPELEPRTVVVSALELAVVDAERLRIEVACSKGTYVRSLARDIGERLGCGAALASLVRTRFGPFALSDALDLSALESEAGAELARAAVIAPAAAIAHLRALQVDATTVARLRAGQQGALGALARPRSSGEKARVLDPDGALAAVVGEVASAWRLERVFAQPSSCAP